MADVTIYELLHEDHARIQALLDRLDETADSVRDRRALLARLEESIATHTKFEEDVFYAALRQHAETEELANAGNEEHAAAAHLLAELRELRTGEPRWGEKFLELKNSLQRHFEDEEHERFEQARLVLSRDSVLELGRRFAARRTAVAGA